MRILSVDVKRCVIGIFFYGVTNILLDLGLYFKMGYLLNGGVAALILSFDIDLFFSVYETLAPKA